jgi:hypothetical protein
VPDGWTEDGTTRGTESWIRAYNGPEGGGEGGPSTRAKSAVANGNGINPLVNLFLSIWSLGLLEKIATFSEKYGRGDWVKTSPINEAGKERKRLILVPCTPNDFYKIILLSQLPTPLFLAIAGTLGNALTFRVTVWCQNYVGVDRKDRDRSDWTTSVRINRFYLRIFFWLLDATGHLMYNIVIRIASEPE